MTRVHRCTRSSLVVEGAWDHQVARIDHRNPSEDLEASWMRARSHEHKVETIVCEVFWLRQQVFAVRKDTLDLDPIRQIWFTDHADSRPRNSEVQAGDAFGEDSESVVLRPGKG